MAPRYTMVCDGISWFTMVYHGIPRHTMAYHRIQFHTVVIPWCTMVYHGEPPRVRLQGVWSDAFSQRSTVQAPLPMETVRTGQRLQPPRTEPNRGLPDVYISYEESSARWAIPPWGTTNMQTPHSPTPSHYHGIAHGDSILNNCEGRPPHSLLQGS